MFCFLSKAESVSLSGKRFAFVPGSPRTSPAPRPATHGSKASFFNNPPARSFRDRFIESGNCFSKRHETALVLVANTMDSQTMYERGRPVTSAGPDHERGGPAPSPRFVVDEDGRKWYPFAVPHAGGFTIDYSLDPNPVAPIDTGAPSNNPADYYVPQPRTVALSEPSRLPRPNRGFWWSGNDTRARTVPAAPARASC